MNSAPSWATEAAATPVRTPMPSRPNTVAISSLDSGSSSGSSRSIASTTVTCAPNLENTWASSAPIGPPPRITSAAGTRSASMASRLVQYGVPARPGMGGMAGAVPVPMMIPRLRLQHVAAHGDLAGRGDLAVAAEQPAALAGEPVGGHRVIPVVGRL